MWLVVVDSSAVLRVVWLIVCFFLCANATLSKAHIRTNHAIGTVKSAEKLSKAALYTLKTCIKVGG
jgi:hypothetical protein